MLKCEINNINVNFDEKNFSYFLIFWDAHRM